MRAGSGASTWRRPRGLQAVADGELATRRGPGWRREAIFSARLQRIALAYVLVTLPVVAVLGSRVRGEADYITAWALVGGLYTVPALVITHVAVRRAPDGDGAFWRAWVAGLWLVFGCGTCLVGRAQTGWDTRPAAAVLAAAALAVYGWAVTALVQSRSGARLVAVDTIEALMGAILVSTPVVLAFGERFLEARDPWFAVPSAVAAGGAIMALFLAVGVYVKVPGGRLVAAVVGIAFAALATSSALAHAAHGVSGFTLPGGPLLALQGAWMAMLLLFPLHLPRARMPGLDRLPPEAQIRGWQATLGLAGLALVALPALTVQAVVLRDELPWAPVVALVAVGSLVVLSTARHLLTVMETRRLHGQVQRAAEDRRRLLGDVLQSAEDDHHRLAAQLHEQAVSSYAAFVTFMRAVPSLEDGASPVAGVMAIMTRDLERQAEALRQLVLAVRPLDVREWGSRTWAPTISAFTDSLYGDLVAPELEVVVADELALDWTTETIVLRIVKEAIRNVRHHSDATRVAVSMRARGRSVELRVEDDGVGFDPQAILFESGIATMRTFAALAQGQVAIESEPGRGTTVVAVLGGHIGPGSVSGAGPGGAGEVRRRHLRIVHSSGEPAPGGPAPGGPVPGEPLGGGTEAMPPDG
jgi:signal transduction histidine kinase